MFFLKRGKCSQGESLSFSCKKELALDSPGDPVCDVVSPFGDILHDCCGTLQRRRAAREINVSVYLVSSARRFENTHDSCILSEEGHCTHLDGVVDGSAEVHGCATHDVDGVYALRHARTDDALHGELP